MATDKQIAANRRNSQKSTGPKTPEGKRAIAQNHLRHGLYATELPIAVESREAYDSLAQSMLRHFSPANPVEEALVQNMIVNRWKVIRIWGMESAVLDQEIETQSLENPSLASKRPAARAGLAFLGLSARDAGFGSISRAEAAADRSYLRSLRQLRQMRKEDEITVQSQF